jgi:NAD-dependent SIR2 family protein deacetylase
MAYRGRTVFILGAGFSHCVGAPMMREFLSSAEDVAYGLTDETEKEAFRSIAEARSHFQLAQAKTSLDLHNLEAVFSAIDVSERLMGGHGLPHFEQTSAAQTLSDAMRIVIARTLERTVTFHRHAVGSPVEPNRAHLGIAHAIAGIRREHAVDVLTFNYDVALEVALHARGISYSYGLGDELGEIDLLKLHGSLNWYRCRACDKPPIKTVLISDVLNRARKRPSTKQDPNRVHLEVSGQVPKTVLECSHESIHPVIVPPIWDKSSLQQAMVPVWTRAAKVLGQATRIIVIGYSWPETDQYVRMLLSLGLTGPEILREFAVFDVQQSTLDRYERLLGDQVRGVFHPSKDGLNGALAWLQQKGYIPGQY